MRDGVEITAYLVNESRAHQPELSRDWLAEDWIPGASRSAVRQLWREYSGSVYPHDDLLVALRGRCVLDTLSEALRRVPDTVLAVLGAGFSSYPWLLPFGRSVEVDLPDVILAKERRAAELRSDGRIDDRCVTHLPGDLADERQLRELCARIESIAAGRPTAVVAEGVVFYLPPHSAQAIAQLGSSIGCGAPAIISYWPSGTDQHPVLAAQRDWFRRHSVPDNATYHSPADFAVEPGEMVHAFCPEELQRQHLGTVRVPESSLIPEYVAVVTTR